ncbi:MAG: tRNA-dihydrouridine synthase [Thermoleophilia bacterium]|nr:tRNA-dihydrouridine synthase [Thermoleophilia bacterium]MDH3725848.1 tRNA-dihydrouridine synthase [Thermoleophilia bacterium]
MRKRMRAVLANRGREAAPLPDTDSWPLGSPFRIGGVEIANRVIQAPLAGIANWAYRTQSRRHGAGATVSEMLASQGLIHDSRKTRDMLVVKPDEHPVGVQLFGADPEAMARAAREVEQAGADFVDINMGCPVKKICRTGAGAALLADPGGGARVVEAMTAAVDIPVTVKMRRGTTPATAQPTIAARRFVDAGAAAICFHPRAAAEEYDGLADHTITREVVDAVEVPVIASGDINDPATALEVMRSTGCQAVAVGRGALGNPWLFTALATGEIGDPPGPAEVISELERFAADACEALGEARACPYLRKFYPWYLAPLPVSKAELQAMLTAPTVDDALGAVRDLVASAA